MKLMIVITLALVAYVAAAPPSSSDQNAQVLRSNFDQELEGAYVFSFETDNGILRSENGELKQALDEENKPHNVVVVRGEYTYPSSDDGHPVKVTYYADETGFHAEGDSIPKSQ